MSGACASLPDTSIAVVGDVGVGRQSESAQVAGASAGEHRQSGAPSMHSHLAAPVALAGLGDRVVDALVRKHMLEFMRIRLRDHDLGGASHHFVLSARVAQGQRIALPSLADVTDPGRRADLSVSATKASDDLPGFAFQAEHGGPSSCSVTVPQEQREVRGEKGLPILFFVVQCLTPSREVVVKGAAKVQGASDLVVFALDLVELRRRPLSARVSLEGAGEGQDPDADCMMLLTPNTFSVADLSRMCLWRCAPVDSYDFGIDVPASLRNIVQECVNKLLGFGHTVAAEQVVYQHDAAERAGHALALEFLATHNLVHRDLESDAWCLTLLGQRSLALTVEVDQPTLLFVPRAGTRKEDRCTFEHYHELRNAGWIFKVRGPGQRCAPYMVGGQKIAWVKVNDRTIKASYLLALILAPQHGVEVKHFETAKYYDAIIEGKPPPRKRARRFSGISLGAAPLGRINGQR